MQLIGNNYDNLPPPGLDIKLKAKALFTSPSGLIRSNGKINSFARDGYEKLITSINIIFGHAQTIPSDTDHTSPFCNVWKPEDQSRLASSGISRHEAIDGRLSVLAVLYRLLIIMFWRMAILQGDRTLYKEIGNIIRSVYTIFKELTKIRNANSSIPVIGCTIIV